MAHALASKAFSSSNQLLELTQGSGIVTELEVVGLLGTHGKDLSLLGLLLDLGLLGLDLTEQLEQVKVKLAI